MPTRVLFVCLGNICRSPLGEGIFRHLVDEAGLDADFEIDSAGTGHWHVGSPPDPRARDVARRNGVDVESLRGRQVSSDDFRRFDHILAMDRQNLDELLRRRPADADADVRLLRAHDPEGGDDVPDPYYGGRSGFDDVYTMIERCCRSLLGTLRSGAS